MISKKIRIGCLITIFSMASIVGFVGCTKEKKEVNNKVFEEKNKVSIDNKKENTIKTKKYINTKNTDIEDKIKFLKDKLKNNTKPTFNSEWINSNDNNLSACIEGKGPDIQEEGIGKIFIKNLKNNDMWSFKIKSKNKNDSPKYIKWCDNENIFVIIGNGFGTISKGGNLYKLNIKNLKLEEVYVSKNPKEEVISVKKNSNILEFDILVYEDDEFLKSHIEKKSIDFK